MAAPRVSPSTVDRIHAWEAQHQQGSTHAAEFARSKSPARALRPESASRSETPRPEPARSSRPEAAPAAAAQASGREATSADFDKAVEQRSTVRKRNAKPDPDVPLDPPAAARPEGAPQSRSMAPGSQTSRTAPPQAKLLYVHGHLVVPPPLFGSHEILVHQNEIANSEGLNRIQDQADLDSLRARRLLVPIPVGIGLRVDPRLPTDRRYTRPWTAKFLADLARAHAAKFGRPLQVNSAVRTVDFQLHLGEYNGNAAGVDGDTASPHLTGQAVDLAKHGLSTTEIAWMRAYLEPLIAAGKIDVEEEFQQACFHISVYRKYAPPSAPVQPRRILVAEHKTSRRATHAALATAIP